MAEISTNISNLEHKLELMQLLQTKEGSTPSLSIKKAKSTATKEQQPSEEEDTKSIAQTPKVEALEGKDNAKSASASSVAALVDEEEPPATLADESHVELEEEELLDEAQEEAFDDELKEESKDQEIEEAEEPETAVEEEESTEVVHDDQISSSEGVPKPKTGATKAEAVKPSSQPGASSQVVIIIKNKI